MNIWRSPNALAVVATVVAFAGSGRAEGLDPPWSQDGLAPIPQWVRSVAPKPGEDGAMGDMVLSAEPSRSGPRRGVTARGSLLPLYGQQRASGCSGPWWLVGPIAWTCSDSASMSAAPPTVDDASAHPLPPYFFVTNSDANAYESRDAIEQGAPDRQLEVGWGVAVTDHATLGGAQWARTTKGLWIATSDLASARVSAFRGEPLDGRLPSLAWVVANGATVWPTPAGPPKGKRATPLGVKSRFEVVQVREEQGDMVSVDEGVWIRKSDLTRPGLSAPPNEVVGPRERWIDVDRASQTLVAYEGSAPVYATLVSTGRGPDETTLTPAGVHRVWIKLLTSDMGHAERDDADANYSLEDVPYVQFFDRTIALHGTYWHSDFGHARSHGCVNLSVADASWLFAFTSPRLPAPWTAAAPTPADAGTIVRVR